MLISYKCIVRDCQKKHWSKHQLECHLGSPIAVPFVLNIPKYKATYRIISNLILKYAQYSVDVLDRSTNDVLSNFSNKSSLLMSSEESNDSNSDWKNSVALIFIRKENIF